MNNKGTLINLLQPIGQDSVKIVGRRPRDKNGGNEGSSNNNDVKRVCANPLDRLCEQLLDWEFLNTLQNDKKRPISTGKLSKLPIIFHNYMEYIKLWEPLVVEEIKETAISNFVSQGPHNIRTGFIQFKANETIPTALFSIEAIFRANNTNRNNLPDSDL